MVCPGHTAGKRLSLGSGPRFETIQNLFSSTRPLHLLCFIPIFTRKTKNKPQVQAWKFCASPILHPVPRNLWPCPFPACLAACREALIPLFPTWPQSTGLQVQLELQLHTGKHAQKDLDQMGPLPGPTYEQGLLRTQSLAWPYDREGLHPTTAQKCSASYTSCTRQNISPSFINASNVCM